MKGHSEDRKTWLLVGLVVIAVIIAVVVIARSVGTPKVVPSEEMAEPPLPTDPNQAEMVIRERAFQDKLVGLDDETRRERHQRRMQQLEEIKAKAHGTSTQGH